MPAELASEGHRLRYLTIFGLLALAAFPALAAKRLTEAQLEQSLTAAAAKHQPDSEIAKQISAATLTERITQASFTRMTAHFAPTSQAFLALRLLADQSEFLPLPAAETASDPAPDSNTQARILDAARNYVSQSLPRLPNFLATRTINHYDDTPHPVTPGAWPTRAGFHLVGVSRGEISVGREREDQPAAQDTAVWKAGFGLVSGGEFGSALGMILTDAQNGAMNWSHWERTPSGTLAVFNYTVPAPASHFEILSSFQREVDIEAVRGPANARGISGVAMQPNVSSDNVAVVKSTPAYHGAIWVNPADGVIYRVTMEADSFKDTPYNRAAMLVEYGPVEISGSSFVCPVRSLALSQTTATAETTAEGTATEWLNETLFTGYHRFASTARMVEQAASEPESPPPAEPATEPPPQQSAPAEPVAEKTPQPAAAQTASAPQATLPVPPPSAPPPPAQIAGSTPPSPGAGVASESAAPPPNPPPPAEPAASSPPPALPAPDPAGAGNFTLHVSVNSLLVPAVVLDKSGHAIGGLGKQDFVVTDNGKRQAITGFTLVQSARPAAVSNTMPAAAPAVASPTAAPVVASPPPTPHRFIVLLFDDRHLNSSDLAQTQKAATGWLEKPIPDSDYFDVLSFMGANSGITRDRDALHSAIMKLSVHQVFKSSTGYCPDIDYYSADKIINQHDAMEFQVAVDKAKQCSAFQTYAAPSSANIYAGLDNATDPFQKAAMAAASHALEVGDEDSRETLASLLNIVHAMARLPGQRLLIVLSPGFLSMSGQSMVMKSQIMDAAAAAGVVVNALDVRGLYVGNVDAGEGANSTLGAVTGQQSQDRLDSMQSGENAMSELADGTGGRFFHNSNDLQGGLASLAAPPENLYLLEIPLDGVKPDGAYHRLQVKVDQRGLDVIARKGYVAPKAENHKK